MKLTHLFLFLGLVSISLSVIASESATDCQSAGDTLRAGIQENPDKVLMFFDDAIKSNPSCLRALLRVTVAKVANDPGLLTQVIHIAVHEYPEKNDLVAQTAFEVAPQSSEVIKNAFFSMPPQQMAEAEQPGRKLSPVDRYLGGTQPELEAVSPISANANETILEAISHLDHQISLGEEEETTNFSYRAPDRISVTELEGKVDETTLEESGPLDEVEEEFEGDLNLTFEDPETERRELVLDPKKEKELIAAALEEKAQEEPEAMEVERELPEESEVAISHPGEIPPSMSTYFIPRLASAGHSAAPAAHLSIVLRSVPVSPTNPR